MHSYWMLARLLRRFPALAEAAEIRTLFDAQLTPAKVARERAYLERASSRGFERPYGWAWLLKLAAELTNLDKAWAVALQPLAEAFAGRLAAFLPKAAFPVRSGTHSSTAFALALARDYAVAAGADALLELLKSKAAEWFGQDREYRGWEPGGDDFLSPALIEAECMRRLLPGTQWQHWFDRFLPDLHKGVPEALFRPVPVSDRTDGKIAHLDGLNLSRAWCWRALGSALPRQDPRRALAETAAADHVDASLPHVEEEYMGAHWLPSFAVLALEGAQA